MLDTEQFEQAEASYRREIELTPEHFGPYHQLGVVLNRLTRNAEAIELFKRAIALNPGSAASYFSLGCAYTDFDDTSEEGLALAQSNFEKAVALEPNVSDFHYELGFSYWRGAQLDRALASFDKAIERNPDNAKARWARVMLWAPAFSSKGADDSPERSGFGGELARFEDWWVKSESDGALFVGELQPFFLTYQEESNVALLKQYGRICAMAMQRWLDRQKSPAVKRPVGKRIRLGIVSADIRLHSVWMALIKGWFQSFDPDRFELVVFSLADRADGETSWARSKSDVFVGGRKTLVSVGRHDARAELRSPALSRRRTPSDDPQAGEPAFGAGPDQYLGSSRYVRRADTRLLRFRGLLRARGCAGSLFRDSSYSCPTLATAYSRWLSQAAILVSPR